jgi:hypothetical protein
MPHNPGFLNLVNDAKRRVREIDIEGYRAIVSSGEAHVLVDTREESEWAAGHVKGAVHMSKGVIERDIETKVPDKETKLRRLSFGPGGRQPAEDGLHQRYLTGRRLEGAEGFGSGSGEVSGGLPRQATAHKAWQAEAPAPPSSCKTRAAG